MASDAAAMDAYYTPAWLADALVSHIPERFSGLVLDPCAGGGSLLQAAQRRFGSAVQLAGMDLDRRAVDQMQSVHEDWLVSRGNLLRRSSRSSASAWRRAQQNLGVVVLNPPFSYRGSGGILVRYRDFSGRVSPAMQFLCEVLGGLNPTHGVFAILPDGALHAERHEQLWNHIRSEYSVEVLDRIRTSTFHGARVSTSLVHLTRGRASEEFAASPVPMVTSSADCRCVEVIRGRVPIHKLPDFDAGSFAPVLHTTSLRSGEAAGHAPTYLSDSSPFVLIARVGRWDGPLVVDVGSPVLSDCVIALRTPSRDALAALQSSLRLHEDGFRTLYRGTGAQYVTLESVTRQLANLGWSPRVVKASSTPSACVCAEADAAVRA